MITALELLTAARTLLGTPYRHQGRSDRGVDCIGFLFATAQRAGLDLMAELPPPEEGMPQWDYGRHPDGRALAHTMRWCTKVKAAELGAIVLFQYKGAAHPQHFGILGEGGRTVIHAHQPYLQVVEHGFRAPWTRWAHSFYRVPGVTYGATE